MSPLGGMIEARSGDLAPVVAFLSVLQGAEHRPQGDRATPISFSTRSESAFDVGSMIRAKTSWAKASSAMASNPSLAGCRPQ